MDAAFTRTAWLLGRETCERLARAHVAVFGIGGVGSIAAEALARSGVGRFTLIDPDRVDVTNINRQIHATHETIGQYKTAAHRNRLMQINPRVSVETAEVFFMRENDLPVWDFDCVLDAVDTVTAKIAIITAAQRRGIPVVSSMGAGNRLDPTLFRAADIYETHTCPLAKIMRKLCRDAGIASLRVIFSAEPPRAPAAGTPGARRVIGSCMPATAAAGLALAAEGISVLAAAPPSAKLPI